MSRIFILWNDSYSVGIKKIDDQHKHLISIINKLFECYVDQTIGKKIEEILIELENYAQYHFAQEELLFDEFNYPDKENHVLEHATFIGKVEKFRYSIDNGNSNVSFQLINFLRNWLVDHICGSDKEYISYLREGAEE